MSQPSSHPFNHVLIVGCGLLGTSLGLAIKKRGLARTITGVGRPGSASLEIARARGAVDHASTDLAQAAQGHHLSPPLPRLPADLIVLCTPIGQFPEAFRTLAPVAAPGTLITDVGSTKAQVLRWAGELLPPCVTFIGSHPMAGSEKSGPEAARENLYDHAICLLCSDPAQGAAPDLSGQRSAGLRAIDQLWKALGMRTLHLPADTHDRWVATISHLPHAVAFSLVNTAAKHPEMLQAVAGGFLDTTRIASSDISMWTDIFLTNKAALVGAIDAFAAGLADLRQAVAAGDEPAIRALLTRARKARDELLAARQAQGLSTRSNHGGDAS